MNGHYIYIRIGTVDDKKSIIEEARGEATREREERLHQATFFLHITRDSPTRGTVGGLDSHLLGCPAAREACGPLAAPACSLLQHFFYARAAAARTNSTSKPTEETQRQS